MKLSTFSGNIDNNEDKIISNYTKITPVSNDLVTFSCSETISSEAVTANISDIEKFVKDQLVNVKAEVVEISRPKLINTMYQGQLSKQEVLIRNTTSSICLVLWEKYVDSLEVKKTYILQNLRLNIAKGEKYLNTAKSEDFVFNETTPFAKQILVKVDEGISTITTTTVTGKIIGVHNVLKGFSCVTFNKKVNVATGQTIAQNCVADNCKLHQKVDS